LSRLCALVVSTSHEKLCLFGARVFVARAAGIRSPSVESRVFEVAKTDKKVVWEFRFPTDYGVYRARRITPPLVRAITP
jgi:hypothetical protein